MPFPSSRVLATTKKSHLGIDTKWLGLTAEQQTKLSWAKRITSFSGVPEIFRGSFESLLGNATQFPYTVLTPSSVGFVTRTKEKLVSCLDDKVIVLEQIRGNLTPTCYCIGDIRYIQVGRALLQSWVNIRGLASDGVLTSSEFRFNTVSDYLFAPIVERLRPVAECSTGSDPSLEHSKFDYLNRLNFKLMNYARHSILPSEKIVQIIFQPEIRTHALRLLGKSLSSILCSPHLCIVTDRELILVQDGVGKRWGRQVQYGGIWHYIPLDMITGISSAETQTDQVTMSVQLLGDDHIVRPFSISNREELAELSSQLEATRGE